MNMKSLTLSAVLVACLQLAPLVGAQATGALKEPPLLEPLVKSGELPPMAERLPEQPLVVDIDRGVADPQVLGPFEAAHVAIPLQQPQRQPGK